MRFVTLITALTFAAPVHAQGNPIANGSQIGDWVVRCDAVTTTQTACRVQQVLSIAETGQIVVNFVAIPNGAESALLVAQVPMGVHLPSGAVFRDASDDGSPQTQMIWQQCSGQICEAAIGLTNAELVSLSAMGTILFGYSLSRDSAPIIVEVDVSTLLDALQAIRG